MSTEAPARKATGADAGKYASVEAKIDEKRVIDFFKSVVRIPSERFKEHDVARHIGAYMDGMGMKVTYHPFSQNGVGMLNVVGRYGPNTGGKRILLCAHMDTGSGQYQGLVFQRDKWTKDPLDPVVEGGYLYGLGTLNDKQGVACAIGAADAVIKSGVPFDGEIVLAFVCAETILGVGAGHLFGKGFDADLAIILEGTGLDIVTVSIGEVRGRIIVKGEHKHHEPHANPVETVRYLLDAFTPGYGDNKAKKFLTSKVVEPELPGVPAGALRWIHSDPADLDRVNVFFDTMCLEDQTPESVKKDLERLVADIRREHPDFDAEVDVEGWEPPGSGNFIYGASPTDTESPIVTVVAAHHEQVRGKKPVIGAGRRYGAGSDASVLKRVGIPTIEYAPGTFGPGGDVERWPTTDERINVKDVMDCTRVVARSLVDLLNQPRGKG
ncbi:MAG: acetylornithine deacetylase [Chloroflexota bacterium]|nr:acetylornithine deacetylase [Chloroflexota bacterium]